MGDQIIYSPLPGTTPEAELDALVAVYTFLIDRHTSRKAAGLGGAEKTEGGGDNHREPEASVG